MTERNGDGPHKTAPEVPVGRPFSPGHDERRNAGGRPRGLAAAARAVVGDDGRALVEFHNAIMRGDAKVLGVRQIALRDRLQAAAWLSDRAFGKAPIVIEPPDEPAGPFTPEATSTLREMPEDLKRQIRQWLESRRAEYLAREREAAEQRMLSYMPSDGPDRNGDGPR